MKSFEDLQKELQELDAAFDSNDFDSCVKRAMLLIRLREAQMTEEGYKWPFDTESCRARVEREITNRASNETMMSAAIRYIERVEHIAEDFNGIRN